MSLRPTLFAAVGLASLFPGLAVAQNSEDDTPNHAVGADVYYSSDADDTETIKIGADFDLRYKSPDDYLGFRLEKARFSPLGQRGVSDHRAYIRFARDLGGWKAKTQIGTDGHTALGSVSIYDEARVRKELFIERDIVETPMGIGQRIYYTYGGAAIDLPVNDRNAVTLLGGVQDFTGRNVRMHLRGNYVHVVKPEWGLSVQLRGRYFNNSEPREFDYYSPRWYMEILPVVQVRRFTAGWMLLGALGLGAQRDSDSGWRQSRYVHARAVSPANRTGWSLTAGATYSNNPIPSGSTYSYFQVNLGIRRAF